MNFAMLGAAAILVSTNAVAAAEINLDGRCDYIIVTHSRDSYEGLYDSCHTKPLQSGWGGWRGRTRGIGENVALHFYDDSVRVPIPYVFDVQLPLMTGKHWVLCKSPELASGTYTVTSK